MAHPEIPHTTMHTLKHLQSPSHQTKAHQMLPSMQVVYIHCNVSMNRQLSQRTAPECHVSARAKGNKKVTVVAVDD